MPEPKSDLTALENMRTHLSVDFLGQIPLFLSQSKVVAKETVDLGPVQYRRPIEVRSYQTRAYETRGYHKAISKIV